MKYATKINMLIIQASAQTKQYTQDEKNNDHDGYYCHCNNEINFRTK